MGRAGDSRRTSSSFLFRVRMVVMLGRNAFLGKGSGHGSVYGGRGCQNESTGSLLGARCPRLRSSSHRLWYFSTDLPVCRNSGTLMQLDYLTTILLRNPSVVVVSGARQ